MKDAEEQTYPASRLSFHRRRYVLIEALPALLGLPGIGWMLSGRPVIGLPLAIMGPVLATAVIPSLVSPFGSGFLARFPLEVEIAYLVLSASLSAGALWFISSKRARTQHSTTNTPGNRRQVSPPG